MIRPGHYEGLVTRGGRSLEVRSFCSSKQAATKLEQDRLSPVLIFDTMDNLVAPEGVYTMTEEQKPPPPHANLPSTQQVYPTRLSTVIVNFPQPKSSGPGFSALLGGTIKPKDGDKQGKKGASNGNNGYEDSLSSSDQGDEISDPTEADLTSPVQATPTSLFSPGPDTVSKKKSTRRPKHNIRTTSSSFVTRLQSMENLNRHLSSKVGETTFLFYNAAKSFFWTEVGSKGKVRHPSFSNIYILSSERLSWDLGPTSPYHLFCPPYLPLCQLCDCKSQRN